MVIRELLVRLGVQRDRGSFQQAERGIDRLARAGRALGALFAAGAAAQGFRTIINLASEAGEAQNKFQAVFTDAADGVAASLQDISKRTGQSTLQLQQFASNLGALVRPQIGSAQAAGDLAAQFSELAFDIASFNDVRPEEALVALRSGLIGSAEPLQRFGVDVRVAALEQEALRMGVRGTFKDLSEQQKIFIRQSAILRQLGEQGALGDAERTSRTFANASRALSGRLRELGARLGAFVLPAVERLVLSLMDVTGGALAFLEANKDIIGLNVQRVFSAIANVVGAVFRVFSQLANGVVEFVGVMSSAHRSIFILTAAFGVLIALLGIPTTLLLAIGAAIFLVIDDLERMGEGGNSVIGTLITAFQDLLAQTGSVAGAIAEVFINAFTFWTTEVFGLSRDTVNGIVDLFRTLGGFVSRIFQNIIDVAIAPLAGAISAAQQAIDGNLSAALETVKTTATTVGGAIADTFDAFSGDSLFGGGAREAADRLNRSSVVAGGSIGGSPAALAQAANNVSTAVNATLNIQGGPGQSAEAIGRGAVDRLNQLSASRNRQALSAAGLGGRP